MSFLTALGAFNYGLVLICGLFLSAAIAGGWENRRQKRLIIALCPLFLLIQTPCWLILGESATKQLYPLIVHLPLVLILIVAGVIYSIVRDKKKGKSLCGGNCGHCAMGCSCHKQ